MRTHLGQKLLHPKPNAQLLKADLFFFAKLSIQNTIVDLKVDFAAFCYSVDFAYTSSHQLTCAVNEAFLFK